ncbi:NADH-quinone oxidoreductase subunit C [Occallatibacter riparius]|uniref:NADH-quinone oxidoreductase subunit C n=1 Tax=Occallatibacter riparius TaxID=1002689 RepID=A0A9J7BLF3_9BACT|nr:NADH-quinone oxidoreductase subunit C [Occallatibacter riparius]UWZ83592.1 NADH-quinone oxidoreductase subunit C [Occallatibacter riparius]
MSTPASTLPAMPEVPGIWTERGGVFWLDEHGLNVREVAASMNASGARFVTITAYQLPKDEGFRLEYHWDLAGRLLGFGFNVAGSSTDSIYDLCEASDWIEREIHEGFGINFTGREYEPLQIRSGAAIGVNLREIGQPGPTPKQEVLQ